MLTMTIVPPYSGRCGAPFSEHAAIAAIIVNSARFIMWVKLQPWLGGESANWLDRKPTF
jgi:hypothetical protein